MPPTAWCLVNGVVLWRRPWLDCERVLKVIPEVAPRWRGAGIRSGLWQDENGWARFREAESRISGVSKERGRGTRQTVETPSWLRVPLRWPVLCVKEPPSTETHDGKQRCTLAWLCYSNPRTPSVTAVTSSTYPLVKRWGHLFFTRATLLTSKYRLKSGTLGKNWGSSALSLLVWNQWNNKVYSARKCTHIQVII